MKFAFDISILKPIHLTRYAEMCGRTLARAREITAEQRNRLDGIYNAVTERE
jgi:hypothetical protein